VSAPLLLESYNIALTQDMGSLEREEWAGERVLCDYYHHIANSMMAKIHDRMPVILAESDLAVWLDQKAGNL
jgi:hypothetical protein